MLRSKFFLCSVSISGNCENTVSIPSFMETSITVASEIDSISCVDFSLLKIAIYISS